MASSRVSARVETSPSCTPKSEVWPPETTRPMKRSGGTRAGPGSEGGGRNGEYRCPSRWWTAWKGLSRAKATALPMERPTRSAPTRPGPRVAATRSTSAMEAPARESASELTRGQFDRCSREAISGTTPPYGRCAASWLDTTDASTRPSPSSTAQAVSSQEVSMPRTRGAGLLLPVAALVALGRLRPARHRDVDGLVDRDLEAQGTVAELLPLVRHVVEDDVLIFEDAVGDDVVLLEVEDGVVVELALDLDLLAVHVLLLLADVLLLLAPVRVLPELLREVCLAVLAHLGHGRSFCYVLKESCRTADAFISPALSTILSKCGEAPRRDSAVKYASAMPLRFGINGFGRIGRALLRIVLTREDLA